MIFHKKILQQQLIKFWFEKKGSQNFVSKVCLCSLLRDELESLIEKKMISLSFVELVGGLF